MNIVQTEIENYALNHTQKSDKIFDELKAETYEQSDCPQMLVGNLEGTLLQLLVKISGAKNALEIGMFTGYSGLRIASALPKDGKLICCDVNPETSKIARKYFDKSGYGHKVEIKLAPALETLERLKDQKFDFVFIDADKQNYPNYFNKVIDMVPSGGLILIDNCIWSGDVLDPKTPEAKAINLVNKMVTTDPRVENTLLTIRDGIMLVRKK